MGKVGYLFFGKKWLIASHFHTEHGFNIITEVIYSSSYPGLYLPRRFSLLMKQLRLQENFLDLWQIKLIEFFIVWFACWTYVILFVGLKIFFFNFFLFLLLVSPFYFIIKHCIFYIFDQILDSFREIYAYSLYFDFLCI